MAKKTERTLSLNQEGRHKADKALLLVGTKRELAAQLEMSPTTITNFFAGRPVDRQKFLKICQALKLKWQDVIEQVASTSSNQNEIESLVRQLRQQIQPYIQNRCGTMRVLNMTQPIGLGEIYTDVNILEKLTANRRLEIEELLAACQVENGTDFDRFGLGQAKEGRKRGLEVVQQYKHLMVLGRPGAGKTTFLKHLAIECLNGNHFADRVPLFVTLKEFAETDDQPDLVNFLATLLPHPDLTQLFSAGRVLLLLDGLDEVKETDIRRVNQQIRSFAERFYQNQIVVTCRIAAKSYIFEQFVEVEVADFNPQQIEIFVRKWFQAKQPQKADRFLERLKEHKPIQELANNPLLLTLLCLIFEEKNKFKESRADLYREGVDLLLEKWDDSRDIDRDQIYKTLSIRRRSDLLSKLALATFETGSYFFHRREAEHQICEYIRNLPGIENTPEALDINSQKILRSIEAQHGLLTERAVDIYSFSHLTFHEYFVALEITQSNQFDLLLNNITNKRWREVILLTASMLRNADDLVRSMKRRIDEILNFEDAQEFLVYVSLKSSLAKAEMTHELYNPVPMKEAALRDFYFKLSFAFWWQIDHTFANERYPIYRLAKSIEPDFSKFVSYISTNSELNSTQPPQPLLVDSYLQNAVDRALERMFEVFDNKYLGGQTAAPALKQVVKLSFDPQLCEQLELLNNKLVKIHKELHKSLDVFEIKERSESFNAKALTIEQSLKDRYLEFTQELIEVMKEYRYIGYSFSFDQEQKQLFLQYYSANQLLVDCLNLPDVYVSQNVREETEATLLLPISAIKEREKSKSGYPSKR